MGHKGWHAICSRNAFMKQEPNKQINEMRGLKRKETNNDE